MPRDDTVYLRHILDAIERIGRHLTGVTYEEFLQSELLQDAVVRQIEIVGEAAGKVSSSVRDRCPELPWREMAGIRNRLIHAYFDIDLRTVWDTVQHDLPGLEQQVRRLLQELES